MLHLEKIGHQYLTDLSTSPARCSHFKRRKVDVLGHSVVFLRLHYL